MGELRRTLACGPLATFTDFRGYLPSTAMRVLLSWSSGKDPAWALHTMRTDGNEVAGLLTTLTRRWPECRCKESAVSCCSLRRGLGAPGPG